MLGLCVGLGEPKSAFWNRTRSVPEMRSHAEHGNEGRGRAWERGDYPTCRNQQTEPVSYETKENASTRDNP